MLYPLGPTITYTLLVNISLNILQYSIQILNQATEEIEHNQDQVSDSIHIKRIMCEPRSDFNNGFPRTP